MNKVLKVVLIVILILFVIGFIGFTYFVGKGVFEGTTNIISREKTNENISLYIDEYTQLNKDYNVEKIDIKSSKFDHNIPTILVSDRDNKNIAVLVHGMGGTKETLPHIARNFLDLGFNCIIYDQRNSGENMADYNTSGVLESYDTLDVISYAKEKMETEDKLLLYGESIGGATALIAASRNDSNIDYLVLDCPVSDSNIFSDEIFNKIKEENGLPVGYMKFAGNIFLKMKLGYTLKDTNAINYIKEKELTEPVLIINSKNDKVTPYEMGKDIYDNILGDRKEIHTEEKYEHVKFGEEDPEGFKEVIKEFIGKY